MCIRDPAGRAVRAGAGAGDLPAGLDTEHYAHALGRQLNFFDVVRTCGGASGNGRGVGISPTCLQQHGIVDVFDDQPGNRFWLFQGIETAIFPGLAAGLLALIVWWVRERVV